jgi:hypothetical protein
VVAHSNFLGGGFQAHVLEVTSRLNSEKDTGGDEEMQLPYAKDANPKEVTEQPVYQQHIGNDGNMRCCFNTLRLE